MMKSAAKLGSEVQTALASAIERTEVGGGAMSQLTAGDSSKVVLPGKGLVATPEQQVLVDYVVERLSQTSHKEQSELLREVANQLGARGRLLRRIRRDIQIQAFLRVWLYVHVPIAVACLAALIAHIVSVFLYW